MASTEVVSSDGRTIFALMLWAGTFALIGHEISPPTPAPGAKPTTTGLSVGGKIILGTFAATAVLTMLSHAGDAGRQFSVGLAMLAAVSSSLVYGKPVWTLLGSLVGHTAATTPTATGTGTQPTQGTANTAVALSNVA